MGNCKGERQRGLLAKKNAWERRRRRRKSRNLNLLAKFEVELFVPKLREITATLKGF